ncbi:MAG: 2-phosphosulfolactate phosphatase [Bacteroidales bacterium]|nr:2-phosphosulfolactate phosphatase [Bacteroidales bacterium]
MNIELILSPTLYDGRQLRAGHDTVAVDILRATSALCAAFKAGASEVVPLSSLDPLPGFRERGFLIAAERNGEKLFGATCGNSPTEYLSMNLDGARLAYSTTNGTVSILRAVDSDNLYVGSFANISALSDTISRSRPDNLVILCSGWKGDPSIEDTLFGGALIARLIEGVQASLVNDAAMMSLDLWNLAGNAPLDFCRKATHVQRLMALGCEADIRWAFFADTCSFVPYYDRQSCSLRLLTGSQPTL